MPDAIRRKRGISTTSRALRDLRELGWTAEKVEQRVGRFITRDFINVIDLIAFRPGSGIMGVQVTSGAHHAARRSKALAEPMLAGWVASGGRFEVWSYAKQGAAGKRKLWTLRREEITLADFVAENGPVTAAETGGKA